MRREHVATTVVTERLLSIPLHAWVVGSIPSTESRGVAATRRVNDERLFAWAFAARLCLGQNRWSP